MKAFGVFVLICVAAFLLSAASAHRPCDVIGKDWWPFGSIRIKTCFLHSTAIDSKDFLITSDRDMTVEGFYAHYNMDLEYLPTNLGAKFPNMLGLVANFCLIKEVKKKNFEGLSNLRWLYLHDNRIENIDDDTFDGIPAVEMINLDHNHIEKLNGRAFASLHKLTTVDLEDNECIDEEFITPARIAEMPQIVTEKCGSVMEYNIETFLSEKFKLEADLKTQLEKVSSLKSRNERLEIEKTQIETLNNESKAQLLLVLVAALASVTILLGIIIAFFKKRQTNSDSVAFRTSNVPE